jgi:fatty acid desaturase
MVVLASEPSGASRARVLEGIPAEWYQPDRRIYWADLLLSATIGWGAFAAAAIAEGLVLRLFLGVVSVFALYRATLFIHELTHMSARDLPGFRVAWNAVAGIPLLLPLFLYEGVHLDHHRPRFYGTRFDPEYVPFGHRPVWVIGIFAATAGLLPVVMLLRFGVLAPISWLNSAVRRLTLQRASSLAINHAYIRQRPLGAGGLVQEAACSVFCWSAVAAWSGGLLSGRIVVEWAVVGAAAAMINAVRVLAAHRYENDGQELTPLGQLLDSKTIVSEPARGVQAFWELLFAPVGLRYHALHHWIPALPYHNLGRAHRHVAGLAQAADYRTTESSMPAAVRDLVGRARRESVQEHLGEVERVG